MKANNARKDSQASDVQDNDPNVNPEIQKQILRALEGLGYGSVEIVVHDSKVVQIERKEKIRLNKNGNGKGR